ncbi:hypothetical protein TNCV_2624741 [Trichonephila clavipes]|nr:hypothetical protein TNCV_2624741 [Trichonephila clavipes]
MFHVLADLEYPCILGDDFISGWKIVLDFDRKALAIPDSQIERVVTTIEEGNVDLTKTRGKIHNIRIIQNPNDERLKLERATHSVVISPPTDICLLVICAVLELSIILLATSARSCGYVAV